jgi:microcompartment protein CcmK/EutM
MNLARIPGQVFIGYASDKLGPRKLILVMTIASTASVLAGWGAATDAGGVIGFALAFGGFADRYRRLDGPCELYC